MHPDFDTLAEQSQKTQSRESMDQLWGATYTLKEWHFAVRGEMPNVQPFVGMVDGKPFLFAFTDSERATGFCRDQGFNDKKGNAQILSMPVEGFVQTAQGYASKGVYGILFNNGSNGYFAPLANVIPMHQYFKDKGTV